MIPEGHLAGPSLMLRRYGDKALKESAAPGRSASGLGSVITARLPAAQPAEAVAIIIYKPNFQHIIEVK